MSDERFSETRRDLFLLRVCDESMINSLICSLLDVYLLFGQVSKQLSQKTDSSFNAIIKVTMIFISDCSIKSNSLRKKNQHNLFS